MYGVPVTSAVTFPAVKLADIVSFASMSVPFVFLLFGSRDALISRPSESPSASLSGFVGSVLLTLISYASESPSPSLSQRYSESPRFSRSLSAIPSISVMPESS